MFLLALTAAGFWWRATNAQHAAEIAREAAEVRRLAGESSSALKKHPQWSLLLAVEAASRKLVQGRHVAPGEQSLRDSLSLVGGQPIVKNMPQIGAVTISTDGHWLVTGCQDGTARLWDLSSKDLAANPTVLRGHEDNVTVVAISPDNHWLVTGGQDAQKYLQKTTTSNKLSLA